jgi:hypothetical protein
MIPPRSGPSTYCASGLRISEAFRCLVKACTHNHAGEEARVRPPANLRVRD